MNETYQIVIIGGGLAGAATAYHLTCAGVKDILVLEQEDSAGFHASGRSAGLVHRISPDHTMTPLLREGTDFIRHLRSLWPIPVVFHEVGSLALASGKMWEGFRALADRGVGHETHLICLTPEEAVKKVPVLEGCKFDGALWCPQDGVVDVKALLKGYLTMAKMKGAKVMTTAKVLGIETKNNFITGVVTASQTIKTMIVVNAAGAWAGEIGQMAKAVKVPLVSYRRHIFTTDPIPWVSSDWPPVWDFTDQVYFRPESGGLLLSPCDADEHPPGDPAVEPAASVAVCLLKEKLARYPKLSDLPIKNCWAGLRTDSKDGRFVIGWDPTIHGFFWVAGLAGYGVSASSAVGRLATDLIGGKEGCNAMSVSPERFV